MPAAALRLPGIRPAVRGLQSRAPCSPFCSPSPRPVLAVLLTLAHTGTATMAHYRKDGVRIQHDPYAEGMAEKYGSAGETDPEGFDPYADTVGPGIYGGRVRRDETGRVLIGAQYQGHNPRPGPVYAGGGYAEIAIALRQGPAAVSALLDRDPALVGDITTGGATPLHLCGMGQDMPDNVDLLVSRGADVDALDSYGYTPLHRMASNNLAGGAAALLRAGADARRNTEGFLGEDPLSIARASNARKVAQVLIEHLNKGH